MISWRRHVRGCRRVARSLGRRCLSGALLAVYVVTAVGIPLPAASGPQKSDELFPCAASACGCKSADRCWRSCCCHTLAQRIAWARTHGVRPPNFALANARKAGIDLAWLGDTSGVWQVAGSRCDSSAQCSMPKCCRAKLAADASMVHARACCEDQPIHSAPANNADRVVAWRALACGGQSMNWLAAVPILISVPMEFYCELPLVAWLRPAASDVACGMADSPAVPPPERA
jgi:hypothetical protein